MSNKNPPKNLPEWVVDNYRWYSQPSGWMNEEIFSNWVDDVFLPAIEKRRWDPQLKDSYALLLVDGHSSPEVRESLAEATAT